MKEIWCAKVAVIQNVEIQHAVPLGVNKHALTPKAHFWINKITHISTFLG